MTVQEREKPHCAQLRDAQRLRLPLEVRRVMALDDEIQRLQQQDAEDRAR
jgi:hypothetical protein